MINTDKLSAGVFILTVKSKELLNGFLLHIGEAEDILKGCDPFVDIDTGKRVETSLK